jgi:LuxR family maltose regulon positive regulatory protein
MVPSVLARRDWRSRRERVPVAWHSGVARTGASATGSRELLQALPRHETAHAALLTDILDVVHGASLTAADQSASPQTEELSPSELKMLRYLPTNLSRPEIASELSVSVNTVNTHIRSIYAKLGASDRSSAVQRARELRLLSAGRTR